VLFCTVLRKRVLCQRLLCRQGSQVGQLLPGEVGLLRQRCGQLPPRR
jgi:hypothetical protein